MSGPITWRDLGRRGFASGREAVGPGLNESADFELHATQVRIRQVLAEREDFDGDDAVVRAWLGAEAIGLRRMARLF